MFATSRWLNWALSLIAAGILFSMMMYTFLDVVGRYFFNAPLPGGFEIVELMMAVLIFSGLPLVSYKDQHVTIDIVDEIWPHWFKKIQHVVVSLVCAVIAATLCWRILVKAQEATTFNDMTAALHIPLAPFFWFMTVMMGLTSLIFLIKAFDLSPHNNDKWSI